MRQSFILNRVYPKYNYFDVYQAQTVQLDFDKEVRFKVTRNSDYGERYKLFLIKENSFEKKYTLQDFGLNVVTDKNKLVIVDTIKWNGLAKKAGFSREILLVNLR